MKSQICIPYAIVWTLRAFVAELCKVSSGPQVTGLPFVKSLSRAWCLTLHFQISDILGPLRVDIPLEQGHFNHAPRNWYADIFLSQYTHTYTYVFQLVNFQWEIQLSRRLDCLIWQISTLCPSRRASWEAKLLIWRSVDDWEMQLPSWPHISDQCTLFLLGTYMGTMLPETTCWAWIENPRNACLKKYLSTELSWGYLTHWRKRFAKETILF